VQHLRGPVENHGTATIPRSPSYRHAPDYELFRSRTTRCLIR
jgi:hypothetical protein